MVMKNLVSLLYSCSLLSLLFSVWLRPSFCQEIPFRAANLGGWLVTEGWMTPSLFDPIPNNDLLDGTQVQLKSTMLNKFVAAENGGGANLVANSDSASGWETFTLWRINDNTFNLRVFSKQFVGLNNQGGGGNNVTAVSSSPGNSETFEIVRNQDDPLRIRIKASNGLFLQLTVLCGVKKTPNANTVSADYGDSSDWGNQNPSVFQMNIVRTLRGEYQLTNGYGPEKASQVLQNHWNTYISEDDFKYLSDHGLNAVRIPVGWWIRYDPTPPQPFVGGSLQALDQAFNWAENHNMKVIVDLHAVPGSHIPDEHSGTRDGNPEWGDSRIQETVQVIEFLAQRYGNRPSLGAIELMNEPREQYVPVSTLSKYYQLGYDAVRNHTSTAYVILSNRLGSSAQNTEFLSLAGGMDRSVIDVHYYNLFSAQFNNLNVQQNVAFIRNDRSAQLQEVTASNGFPLSFVGEWTAEMTQNFLDADYASFAEAQLEVYGKATFGWAYWSYKCTPCGMWSLRRMIDRGLFKL